MRVLLVEDEAALAGSIKRGLATHGIVVQIEHDGEAGLWAARDGEFDAIVLDIMLPKMNGYNVLRALRQEDDWTPVLMLTAKEYLIRNQGQIRSRREILQNVWDAAYEGPENVVEVYVGYLRKKIDQPFGVKSLQTVRGMGYRLIPQELAI